MGLMRWARVARWRALLWAIALLPPLWLAVQFAGVPHFGEFHDDGLYVASAKSLAEGRGYRAASLPGQPWQTKYPPLFPAWLAMAWRANPDFPANLAWLLPLVWVWLPALALISRVVFSDLGFPDPWAWALSAAVLVNPIAAYFGVSIMAELMMATLLMASLAMAERKRPWASGVLAGLAFLTKSAALPALLTIPLVMGMRKQFRQAMYFAIVAWPCFLGWSFWAAAHRAPGSAADYYVDYTGFYLANHSFEDLPSLAAKNVPILVMSAGRLLAFTSQYSGWANYLSTLLGLVAIISFIRMASRLTHYHAFAAAFVPMLVFWNFTPHERFILPVLPLLLAGFAWELRKVPAMVAWAKPFAVACAVAMCWMNAHALFRQIPSIASDARVQAAAMQPVYRKIAAELPLDAEIAAAQDPLVYLYTGRTAKGMHFPTRYFYSDRRDAITQYFADMTGFLAANRLNYALVRPSDHAMDLSPDEVRERHLRVLQDRRLKPLFATQPATMLTLESEGEQSRSLPPDSGGPQAIISRTNPSRSRTSR